METTAPVIAATLSVEGRAARIHVGGRSDPAAEPILLLHGGWGDAALHWGPIWDRLAERFRVVAPELPGFGHGTAEGPRDVPGLAGWCGALLDALGIERAWVAGNGFGGALGWQLAVVARPRVLGLALLNGGPPPPQPWLLRKFLALGVARPFLRHALRNGLLGPVALARGFADPARAPAALRALLDDAEPPPLALLVDAAVRGGATGKAPRVPVAMLWGEADRLPGTDALAMDRLEGAGNPPAFSTLPGAGHVPQLERPAEVAEWLLAFAAAPGGPATPAGP
jgi:pimeloyl-ACP methyl ester carboxylesterase